MEKIPRIGTGVLLINCEGKILIGKRTNTSLGNHKYGLPGGHLDFGETIIECGIREVREETGANIELNKIKIWDYTEDLFEEKHYVTFFMRVYDFSGEISTPEPDKHKQWNWMTWDEIKLLEDKLLTSLYSLTKKYPDFDPLK